MLAAFTSNEGGAKRVLVDGSPAWAAFLDNAGPDAGVARAEGPGPANSNRYVENLICIAGGLFLQRG